MLEYAIRRRQRVADCLQKLKRAQGNNWLAKKIERECFRKEPLITTLEMKAQDITLKNALSDLWSPPQPRYFSMLSKLGLQHALPELASYPPGAWALRFRFTLRKPYLSRDDTDFYIINNPVKKEWVFKTPYVAPSQWKGALRSAMMLALTQALLDESDESIDEAAFLRRRLQLYRLFGKETEGTGEEGGAAAFLNRTLAQARLREEEEDVNEKKLRKKAREIGEEFEKILREKGYRVGEIEGFRGRLHFYPTYFEEIGLEVINPHERDSGAGTLPIHLECVPEGNKGWFTLLYAPLDGAERGVSRVEQARADLELVAKGLAAMFTCYGFGAKTSSGYGVAREQLQQVQLGWRDAKGVQKKPEQEKEQEIDSFAALKRQASSLTWRQAS